MGLSNDLEETELSGGAASAEVFFESFEDFGQASLVWHDRSGFAHDCCSLNGLAVLRMRVINRQLTDEADFELNKSKNRNYYDISHITGPPGSRRDVTRYTSQFVSSAVTANNLVNIHWLTQFTRQKYRVTIG